MVSHYKQMRLAALIALAGSVATVTIWFAFFRSRSLCEKTRMIFADGKTMYTEVRCGEFELFGPGMSLGERALRTGEYRNRDGAVISRVLDGTGIRVIHYPCGALKGIQFYSGGRLSGPGISFSRSGVLTAYRFCDKEHFSHGPSAVYDSATGELKRPLRWYVHGVRSAVPEDSTSVPSEEEEALGTGDF